MLALQTISLDLHQHSFSFLVKCCHYNFLYGSGLFDPRLHQHNADGHQVDALLVFVPAGTQARVEGWIWIFLPPTYTYSTNFVSALLIGAGVAHFDECRSGKPHRGIHASIAKGLLSW